MPQKSSAHKSVVADERIDFSDIPEITPEQFAQGSWVNHGGLRPGAGRKPLGHVRVTLSLSPSVRKRLESRARKEHKTMSALVSELV